MKDKVDSKEVKHFNYANKNVSRLYVGPRDVCSAQDLQNYKIPIWFNDGYCTFHIYLRIYNVD